MTDVLCANNLSMVEGIRHGFFTRAWGNVGLTAAHDTSEVLNNRRRIAEHLSVDADSLLSCYQIHSPDVVTVMAPWNVEDRPRADAMVTRMKGIALGVVTADCVPILFADPEAQVIGAAHAGWRGAVGGVIENTVAAMEKLGAERGRIRTALGPCIWADSYEVGPEFPAPFLAESPRHADFFKASTREGFFLFDLPAYVTRKLQNLGVRDVAPSPADTCADEARFFSHRFSTLRGEQRPGSLISVIVQDVVG